MPSLLSHLQRDSQDFYGRTFEDNYEMPPNERLEAACRAAGAGDIEAVREWLATTDDVNALNVAEPAFGVAGSYGRNSTVLGSCTAKISETIDYEDVDYEAKTNDGRPNHEVPLRAGGQRGRLERLVVLARAPVLSTSISPLIRGAGTCKPRLLVSYMPLAVVPSQKSARSAVRCTSQQCK